MTRKFLALYEGYRSFWDALRRFADEHREALAAYVVALERFAERRGPSRLPDG